MALSHELKKAVLCTPAAPKGDRNLRSPICTDFDISPPIALLRVEMHEGHALEIKDPVRPFRNTWKLPQFAEYVLKIEQIFLAGVPHARVPAIWPLSDLAHWP